MNDKQLAVLIFAVLLFSLISFVALVLLVRKYPFRCMLVSSGVTLASLPFTMTYLCQYWAEGVVNSGIRGSFTILGVELIIAFIYALNMTTIKKLK